LDSCFVTIIGSCCFVSTVTTTPTTAVVIVIVIVVTTAVAIIIVAIIAVVRRRIIPADIALQYCIAVYCCLNLQYTIIIFTIIYLLLIL
jgi:hypothetical protein